MTQQTQTPACPGTLAWPVHTADGYKCPDCGARFGRDQLQGRDDHVPPHYARADHWKVAERQHDTERARLNAHGLDRYGNAVDGSKFGGPAYSGVSG